MGCTLLSLPRNCEMYDAATRGPWTYVDEYADCEFNVSIQRITFLCGNNQELSLFSYRDFRITSAPGSGGYSVIEDLPNMCSQECDTKWVNITVIRSWYSVDIAEEERELQIPVLEKNCNKLYWSSWVEATDCSALQLANHTRTCIDCDGDKIEPALKPLCNGTKMKIDFCRNSAFVFPSQNIFIFGISSVSLALFRFL